MQSGVGPLKTDCDKLILDDTEKAERLNTYFMSVFTADMAICQILVVGLMKVFILIMLSSRL